jgi:HTH-type transcriptional regulator/antitoxin HigA
MHATTKRVGAFSEPDNYMELIQEFPLTHIKNDAHLKRAVEVIDTLVEAKLSHGQQEYLDVLTDLVESYEQKNVHIPDATEADVLQALMVSHRLSQSALAIGVGISQSTIFSVVRGVRSLTRQQVDVLAKHSHVSPAVFFPAQGSCAGRSRSESSPS